MLFLRRTDARSYLRLHRRDVWRSFSGAGFGALDELTEVRLPPRMPATLRSMAAAEVVTYVLAGSLTQVDGAGRRGVVLAGEFQRTSFVAGARHGEGNGSRSGWTHVFAVSLRAPTAARAWPPEQRRFSAAERRGAWCLVASPDGQAGSLRLAQDTRIHSALLGRGQHLVHELAAPRRAWLQVLHGEVALDELVLRAGDGAGVTAERVVSLTARTDAELLLIDSLSGPTNHD
jgi:hypothetical protein